MKSKKTIAIFAAVMLMMTGLAGCSGGCSANGSSAGASISSNSSSSSSSSHPSSSSGSASVPSSSSESSHPSSSSSSGSTSSSGSSSVTTMGTDFGEIGTLPSESLGWGPGGPKDDKNRSQGALLYQDKYGKYNALFIAEDKKVVYLTFDEGYEYGITDDFLDILKEKKVKATFFVTYNFVDTQPELVQRMIDEGHVVGNHSWSHNDYSKMAPKEMAEDMMKLHDLVLQKFDYEMRYFRFPAGNFNEQALATVQAMGYKSLFWSFAYKDWLTDAQPDPAESADKIVAAACPGNIYLLHAVSTTNCQILGDVIDRIKAAGYVWGDPSAL